MLFFQERYSRRSLDTKNYPQVFIYTFYAKITKLVKKLLVERYIFQFFL